MLSNLFLRFLVFGVAYFDFVLPVPHPLSLDPDSGVIAYNSVPELQPQILTIVTHKPELVYPGYWFTAPYEALCQDNCKYVPGQAGPYIYDGYGELVWSGAYQLNGQGQAFDFRPVQYGTTTHLTYVHPEGQGFVLLDDSYHPVRTYVPNSDLKADLHEFQMVEGSNRALVTTTQRIAASSTVLNAGADVLLFSSGFQEVDLETQNVLFEWSAPDHIPITDRSLTYNDRGGGLDFFHLNSVEKTKSGDYLISARHTCTIYMISGKDGSVMWSLGGKKSSFQMLNGLRIAYQHHARIRSDNDTHIVISFFNNGAHSVDQPLKQTSASLVALDKVSMTATEIRRWDRPDGKMSTMRGSVQFLPNDNVFVSWSDGGYCSEFTMDGRLVQEVRFSTDMMGTYRAYKFPFVAKPSDMPALKSSASGTLESQTTMYVSWNGATDVASWNFYSIKPKTTVDEATLLGNATRTGFETTFTVDGLHEYTLAEAVAADGTSLRYSLLAVTMRTHVAEDQAPVVAPVMEEAVTEVAPEAVPEAVRGWTYQFFSDQSTRTGTLVSLWLLASLGALALAVRWRTIWGWC